MLLASACSLFRPHRKLSESDRREITRRLATAVERAGGSEVWVKGGLAGRNFSARTEAPTVALAVPASFERVVAALKTQAKKEGLEARTDRAETKSLWRSDAVQISQGNERVCQWEFRETARLRRAAIVIDDLGQDVEAARKLLRMPFPMTFSVLPRLAHSSEIAEDAHRAGRDIMLHLPMEAEPGAPVRAGQGEIRVGMSGEAVAKTLLTDLESVPHSDGVNNHMGSRATADAALMREVMTVLAARRLYFVDSRTTAESTALDVARRMGVPAFYRSVFLDDTETTAYTLGQLREFRRVVEEQGAALAIGHPHATTLEALAQSLPQFEQDDIQLVPASTLIRLPEVARLSPDTSRRKVGASLRLP